MSSATRLAGVGQMAGPEQGQGLNRVWYNTWDHLGYDEGYSEGYDEGYSDLR